MASDAALKKNKPRVACRTCITTNNTPVSKHDVLFNYVRDTKENSCFLIKNDKAKVSKDDFCFLHFSFCVG